MKMFFFMILTVVIAGCQATNKTSAKPTTNRSSIGLAETKLLIPLLKVNQTALSEQELKQLRKEFLERNPKVDDVIIVTGNEYRCESGRSCPDNSPTVTCTCIARKVTK